MAPQPPIDISTKFGRRRRHLKSKLGCSTCKQRKVKCDERFPQCNNCIKRKVHCGYLDILHQAQEKQTSPISQDDFDEGCNWINCTLPPSPANNSPQSDESDGNSKDNTPTSPETSGVQTISVPLGMTPATSPIDLEHWDVDWLHVLSDEFLPKSINL